MQLIFKSVWSIAVDVVVGPNDGISYRPEQGSKVFIITLFYKTVIKVFLLYIILLYIYAILLYIIMP